MQSIYHLIHLNAETQSGIVVGRVAKLYPAGTASKVFTKKNGCIVKYKYCEIKRLTGTPI